MYSLKGVLNKTIKGYTARWVVRSLVEISDVQYVPLNTHVPVASEPFLFCMPSLILLRGLHFTQNNMKNCVSELSIAV